MGQWNKLLDAQRLQRVNLVKGYAVKGYTATEAASSLGISKQQLYAYAKKHSINFGGGKQYMEKITIVLDDDTYGVDDPDRFAKDADGNTVVVAKVGEAKP